MKKASAVIFVFAVSLMLSVPVYAQTAKEAVMGLKKLQARCQSGIAYRDYSNAVADAKFPVNLFMENADASKYPELTASIDKVMKHYEYAGGLWNHKLSSRFAALIKCDSKLAVEINKLYPQAERVSALSEEDCYFVDSVFPVIWAAASKELENTTKLLAKMDDYSSSELGNLKRENNELNELRAEITRLQKENAILKAKQKKK